MSCFKRELMKFFSLVRNESFLISEGSYDILKRLLGQGSQKPVQYCPNEFFSVNLIKMVI
jgi:hypothetical protein